jgi:hypothetical protein
MTRTLTALAAAAALTVATFAAPQQAEARHGGRVAAGIIGGLAFGALLGAAASNGGYYYAPAPYYAAPRCYWERQRYWNGWRWHTQRVRVCY